MSLQHRMLAILAPWLAVALLGIAGWNLRTHAAAIETLQKERANDRLYIEQELADLRIVQAEIRADIKTIKHSVLGGKDAIR